MRNSIQGLGRGFLSIAAALWLIVALIMLAGCSLFGDELAGEAADVATSTGVGTHATDARDGGARSGLGVETADLDLRRRAAPRAGPGGRGVARAGRVAARDARAGELAP